MVGGRQRGERACKFDLDTHEWMDLPDMGTGRRCPGKVLDTHKSIKVLPFPFASFAMASWLVTSTPDQVAGFEPWPRTL